MEEKESPVSGSAFSQGKLQTESPQATVSGMLPSSPGMNINMEAAAGATCAPAAAAAPGSGGNIESGGGSGSLDLFGKKKRGRPRKYDKDGNLIFPYNSVASAPPGFSFSPSSSSDLSSSKRGRGKHHGSGSLQLFGSFGELFANTAGGDFTPHVVTVGTGEDVAGKIFSFTERGPRGICILSANGAVSNVTIRQPGSSGGILTYEGRFEILSLTGSYTVADKGGVRSRTGGLSVSLAGPDGRVIGGGVAGSIIAASPIQVVLGSFMQNSKGHKRKHYREYSKTTSPPAAPEPLTMAMPISQARPDGETCVTLASQLPGQSHGEGRDISMSEQQVPNMTPSYTAIWNGSGPASEKEQKPSPDINVSATDE